MPSISFGQSIVASNGGTWFTAQIMNSYRS